jgi:hypothetical protein
MTPQWPIYIVSKGRADTRFTAKALDALRVPFHVVIEAPEYAQYAAVISAARLLVLDPAYQRAYDTCDALGETKSKGPGAARNFAWDHARDAGAAWHWVMDDNIRRFARLYLNDKIPVSDGTIFRCMEDYCARYVTVAMGGPSYDYLTKRKQKVNPIIRNTRIYSCNLIRNDVPFRWRGRYNEDTDLSLRLLKAGWCTVQFNAFLQYKAGTQTVRGGCHRDFYAVEGTAPKSEMQVRLHPDVSRLVWKFGRVHHHVDYGPFRANKFVLRDGLTVPDGVDDYGMTLAPKGPRA